MTSSCNIPTLRFSNNSDLLKTEKIRELSTVRSGSTPLRANKAYFKNGKYPWVKTTDLNNSKILKTEESVTELALTDTSLRLFPENSILVAMYGGFNQIGRTGLLTKAAATNQALSVLNVDEEKVKPLYILYYLNSRIARWKRFAASSRKDPNITSSDVGAFPITYCGLKEQQKIADFLTSADIKISQLTEKHRLLKDYKKGVMQQIFRQQIRFKDDDGDVLPEWSYKKLSKITSKVGSGSTPRGGQEAYTSNGVIFIRSQNVYDNKLDLRKIVFIPQSTHTKMKGSKVQKHDVLLNITGASIGRSCVVPKKFEEGNVNQHVCIIRTNSELDPYYLQFFLSSSLGQKIIFQSQAGGGREGLNFESIKLFKIPLPSVKEQQKIAQFLQSLDKKIDAVNEQIEHTKLFKKGLLQQMFV